MTCALPDLLFSTLRARIHFIPSQTLSLAINAVDADGKQREGLTCPDSLVVEGTRQNLLILASGTERRFLRQSCPDLLACDSDMYYCRMQEDLTRFEAMLASYGAISIARVHPFSRFLSCL